MFDTVLFPAVEIDESAAAAALENFETTNKEASRLRGELFTLRRKLAETKKAIDDSSRPIGSGPSEADENPCDAFVAATLAGDPNAEKTIERIWQKSQKRNEEFLIADEKQKAMLKALADAINKRERLLSIVEDDLSIAGSHANKFKAWREYMSVYRPAAIAVCRSLARLRRLEVEHGAAGLNGRLERFTLLNPINDNAILFDECIRAVAEEEKAP